MKQLNKISAGLLLFSFLLSPSFYAQEASKPAKATVMVVTKVHWNMDNDGTNEEWLALEKEYYDKVTAKNEYIINANFLTHYFTADNSEAIWVSTYANWDDIEKANDKTNELIKAAWPDESSRDQFFEKQSAYYTGYHSDEIYNILGGAKNLAEKPTEPLIYYVRVSHLGFPEDGSTEEFKELHNSILENVTYKNTYVKAYYNYRHMWGQDNREYTEVYAVGSLCDIEASFEENQKLMDAKWTAEQQKEFGEKYGKYWSGRHGDYIWTNVPELMK